MSESEEGGTEGGRGGGSKGALGNGDKIDENPMYLHTPPEKPTNAALSPVPSLVHLTHWPSRLEETTRTPVLQ